MTAGFGSSSLKSQNQQRSNTDPKKSDEPSADAKEEDLVVERIRIQNMELRFLHPCHNCWFWFSIHCHL